MILALSSTGDVTSDYVVEALHNDDLPVVRLNTDDMLNTWTFTATPESIRLSSEKASFTDSDVAAVYYRRAKTPEPSRDTAEDAYMYVMREARVALRALYARLTCPWISHHAAVTLAENRPMQMTLARRIGFKVPEWIVTSDPATARSFIDAGRTATKALSYGALGNGQVFHTSLMPEWNDAFADDIRACPTLLQRYVEKRFEYRVTVVDDVVFACKIDSQAKAEYAVDMRRGLMDPGMKHSECRLPGEIDRLCVRIVQDLGLRFGAIDLIEDRDGLFWFLEVNPTGQWAWIEDRTGMPISRTIARALVGRMNG